MELDIAICAPDAGPFSATIDHPFYPLAVGTQWVLEGEDDEGAVLRVEITSLDETEDVSGVTTRVVEERETEDGELVEVSRNFFVVAPDGTLCYYGEDVDDYEDGVIVGHEGAWRAGVDGALPGILIPGDPQVGQSFMQEVAIGVAEDEAVQVAAGETVEVPFGTFTDTIRYEESSPLDSGTSLKIYARGVGLLVDNEIERVPAVQTTPFDEARIFIEFNDTDQDVGVHAFLDGEGWDELQIMNPDGEMIFTVTGEGSVGEIGITELFFEGEEPSLAELPLEEFFDLFPEGEYQFVGRAVEGDELVGTATFTHAIPAGPSVVSPPEGGLVDPSNAVIDWDPVTDPPGIEIVGYQVIVGSFSADLPASRTSVTVPPQFLEPGTSYGFEVLAIEVGGNQTITGGSFETMGSGASADRTIGSRGGGSQIPFEDATIIVELNDTDQDAGIQIFFDGEGWEEVEILNPDGETIFSAEAQGSVGEIGVTEFFLESEEPSLAELPLEDFLALFPPGEYQFTGTTVDGEELESTATFTHAIPAGPVLVSPEEDAVVDLTDLAVVWDAVADPPGSQIVQYQVIVEREDPLRVFSVHVPAEVTSVTVPPEFLDPATEYDFEVLAIEEGGNQTLSESSFSTAAASLQR